MADCLRIFERTEKKYIVTRAQRLALWAAIGWRMRPDSHMRSMVCSLYFDTADRRVIRESIEKPEYKEKVRLRSYGVPAEDGSVFLEIKKKYKGVVYKRREQMTLAEARAYIAGGRLPRDSQILREIDWTLHARGEMRPAAYIAYQREAYVCAEDPGLRVTFDDEILYRGDDLMLEHGVRGVPLLDEGLYVMELKANGAMPLWLADALDDARVFPASFSKYGTAFERYILRSNEGCAMTQEDGGNVRGSAPIVFPCMIPHTI